MARKQWRDDINSRVQELANVAAEAYVRSTGGCSHFTAVGLPNGFVQRFAEKIVEECIRAHVDNYGIDIIGETLQEHFCIDDRWYDEDSH